MIKLDDYPQVKFLNFKDEEEVNKFLYGVDGKEPQPLYKYAQWKNAKRSLKDRYLWMSNPGKWNDPFEGYFLNAEYIDAKGNKCTFPYINNVFCNCLTPDNNSEAHWITYAKEDLGVCLRIHVRELIEKLNNFGLANPQYKIYIGKVSYLKLSQIQSKKIVDIPLDEDTIGTKEKRDIHDPDFCAKLLLLKRNSFRHDNEIRLLFIRDSEMFSDEKEGIQFFYNFKKDTTDNQYPNDQLISRVFTSPFHDTAIRDGIRLELEKKKYGMKRYKVYRSGKDVEYSRIQRSRLYDKISPKKIYLP